MIRRSLTAALLAVLSSLAAPTLTTIQDVLYKADGTRFSGTLTISWNSFVAADNSSIVTQSTTVKVIDGNLRVQLVPSTTSSPSVNYSVTYNSDGRVQFQETWAVPSSSTPLRVRDVRIAVTSDGSSSSDTGGGTTTGPVHESQVVGLIADLGARPVKGPGFAAGRVAVVNSSGAVESASGSPSDCVRVDGSSGPCGSSAAANFVDNDSPSGIVDGSNAVFTLTAVPSPTASLTVYRNGVLMKASLDYTPTGNSIQFVTAAIPQPGDILLASYRTDNGSGADATPSTYSNPQVLCSGAGSATNSVALASLGLCSIAPGLLLAGDRVEIRFDYAHQGTGGGFSIEIHWGASTWMHRDATQTETLVSGRGDAAMLTATAQLSAQSWGSALALATAASVASDAYASGLTLDLRGSVAQGADSLTLVNFTVVRIP